MILYNYNYYLVSFRMRITNNFRGQNIYKFPVFNDVNRYDVQTVTKWCRVRFFINQLVILSTTELFEKVV